MGQNNSNISRPLFNSGSRLFFVLQVCSWLLLGWLVLYFGRDQSFLLINGLHSNIIDHLAFWIAQLSSGYIVISIVVLIFARRFPAVALIAVLTTFWAWYFCIATKYTFFKDWHSPFLQLGNKVHQLPNAQIQPELNFPSTHAAIIVSLATYLAWVLYERRSTGFWLFLGTLVLMYTRIYTGWTYVSDVLAGSCLGTIMGILCILWLPKRVEKWLERRSEWGRDMIIAVLRAAAICTILTNASHFVV